MLIIGIETSNGKCSVSLSRGDEIIYAISNNELSKQAEYLVIMMQQVLEKAEYEFKDIDYIAVSIGPGSFTGIRIGISAAKALGISFQKKVIGVSNFETIFYRINQQKYDAKKRLAIINAYRDEVYICKEIDGIKQNPELIKISDLDGLKDYVIAGSGSILCDEGEILPRFPIPDARLICKVAAEKIYNGDLTEASPLYIRPPDAIKPNLS